MTRFTRRRFIQSIAGIGAALLALPRPAWLATAKQPIQKSIPASGESLAVIGMGTSRTFNVAGDPQSMAQLSAVLDAFFDHGGALIDSSPMYGNAERVLGELLSQAERKDLFAATKVWIDGKQAGVEQMEQSRRLWGVDRFDLMQIHNLRDWRTHLETLKACKAEGRVRYIGITTSHGHDHEELAAILEREPFDFVQFSFNIANRIAEERLLPLAADRGMATLINRPFQRGDLFRRIQGKALPDWATDYDIASWGQFFLKFIASHPAVTCVIPATSKVDHMVDNMGANYGRLPDAETRQRMIQYFES
ncbi:MAG: aldo/keto reductase [Methylohalobius sp. ZOD2]